MGSQALCNHVRPDNDMGNHRNSLKERREMTDQELKDQLDKSICNHCSQNSSDCADTCPLDFDSIELAILDIIRAAHSGLQPGVPSNESKSPCRSSTV